MIPVAILQSRQGGLVNLSYYRGLITSLVSEAKIDAYIVSTEDGFSTLGLSRRFLSSDLDIPEGEIRKLADWNRFENPRVTLVALASRRKTSHLRGVILAPSQRSECYQPFAARTFGRPHRDFYYNVTYEAIAYASRNWGAHRIAISHLSGCGNFHEDIATCNAEALAHYCDLAEGAIDSFIFLSDGEIDLVHLAGIQYLNIEGETGQHRPSSIETERRKGHVLVHLDWSRDA